MLQEILARTPAGSIDDVLAVMAAIDDALPEDDGVQWFNRLYHRVTLAIAGNLSAFEDPAFVAELDIAFANLYFAALGAPSLESAPPAWRPLLASRHTAGLARLQFALAGMNAHINRDLPPALVATFKNLGGRPSRAVKRRRDFDRVNEILVTVEDEVKPEFSRGLVGAVDLAAGDLDDLAAMWSVRSARAAAWTNGEVLWTLGFSPALRDAYFGRLDRMVGFASRGLLAPLRRLLRET